MGAGDYSTRFEWLRATRTTDPDTNARTKTYESNGYLWGSLEVFGADERPDEWGAVRNVVTAQVRLRQFVQIDPADKLRDTGWDDTYRIIGVRRDREAVETICDVELVEGVS